MLQHATIYGLLAIFSSSLLLIAYPTGWSDDVLLTPEDMKWRGNPDVTVDGFHNIWAVWDSTTWANGTGEVLFSKRDSLGACLIAETSVSNNASYSLGPRVAVDASNNLQFVWLNDTPLGWGLWHAKLANDGSVIVPSHLAVSGNNGGYPIEIVMNRYNEINVVWNDIVAGYDQINYTKLDSLGNPIIAKMRVSPANVFSYWPGIGVDSFANIHLAYRADSGPANRLAYTKLDRFGNVLIDNKFFGYGGRPTMIADHSQNIHMVYRDPTEPGITIEYLKIDQSGNILVGPLSLSPFQNNILARMAMDSLQYLHIFWDLEVDPWRIMYTKLDTNGNYVIPPMPIVYTPYSVYPGTPRIAVDLSNRLHLIWLDGRLGTGAADVFYKRGENETAVQEHQKKEQKRSTGLLITPNPCNRVAQIKLTGGQVPGQKTIIHIYDATGRLVDILDGDDPGSHGAIVWDGTDRGGNLLPTGVYIIRLGEFKDGISVPLVLLR